MPQTALPNFKTLQTLSVIPPQGQGSSDHITVLEGQCDPGARVEAKQRVMTPASLAAKKHSYVFCQFVSPVVAHGGGPCDCISK